MRFFLFFSIGLFCFAEMAFAACPAPPVGNVADTVIQMRAHGGNAGMGPTTTLDATEEGALIYDDANNMVKVCDGTNWVEIGGGADLPLNCTYDGAPLIWSASLSKWICGLKSGRELYASPGTHTFTVPADVSQLQIKTWGAGGGRWRSAHYRGGAGGYVEALYNVTAGQNLTIHVGNKGGNGADYVSGSGGGSSAVLDGATVLIVAGGGGGYTQGGPGGNPGVAGGNSGSSNGGGGATQSAHGAGGTGCRTAEAGQATRGGHGRSSNNALGAGPAGGSGYTSGGNGSHYTGAAGGGGGGGGGGYRNGGGGAGGCNASTGGGAGGGGSSWANSSELTSISYATGTANIAPSQGEAGYTGSAGNGENPGLVIINYGSDID